LRPPAALVGEDVKRPNKVRRPPSRVIYRAVVQGVATGPNGVCEQAEWEEMERAKPGIADEAVAERLARGTSGDPVPRITRGTAK
jgi:hypothetical protein